MIDISFIIPAFNAQKTIIKCVDSILNQKNIIMEVIIIDDGSNDETYNTCLNKYKKIEEVILIKQINSGVSKARNEGMKIAKGNFIMFVDSDDFLEKNFLTKIFEYKTFDICIFSYNKIQNNKKCSFFINGEIGSVNKKEFLDIIPGLYESIHLQGPCNKIYKKSIIDLYNLKFLENMSLGEDFIFNIGFILKSEIFYLVKDIGYNYVDTLGSLTKVKRENFYEIQKKIHLNLYKLYHFNKSENKKINSLIFKSYLYSLHYDISKIDEVLNDKKYREFILRLNFNKTLKEELITKILKTEKFIIMKYIIKFNIYKIKIKGILKNENRDFNIKWIL